MEQNSSFAKLVFVLAFIATVIGFTAFSQESGESKSFQKELKSNSDSSGSVERGQNEASKRLQQLDLQLKHLDAKLDHLNVELKNMDFNKIQHEANDAIKDVDKNKISAEVEQSIKNIDWNKINKEVNESVAKLDKMQMTELKKNM